MIFPFFVYFPFVRKELKSNDSRLFAICSVEYSQGARQSIDYAIIILTLMYQAQRSIPIVFLLILKGVHQTNTLH